MCGDHEDGGGICGGGVVECVHWLGVVPGENFGAR